MALQSLRRRFSSELAVFLVFLVIALPACDHSQVHTTRPASTISTDADSQLVKNENANKKLVVFTHGVFGNLRETWRNPQTGSYWFELMKADADLSGFNILLVGYRSPFWSRGMTLEELSTSVLQSLFDDHIFDRYQEIYVVSHSMGGLIWQRMLVMLKTPGKEAVLRKVRCVVFLSTPSNGAPIAALASYISKNPQLSDMRPATLNSWLQAMQNDIVTLRDDREQRNARFPRFYAAYETLATHGIDVASRVYASSPTDRPLMGFPLDHQGMAAPKDTGDRLYKWVKARILEATKTRSAGVGFEEKRARALVVGYDSAFALAHYRMGRDIMADRVTIGGHLKMLGINVEFPLDPLHEAGTQEEKGEPTRLFLENVRGALRVLDPRLERAFVLGFFGVVSLNSPEMTPEGFSIESFAREAGFDTGVLTAQTISKGDYLEGLVKAESDRISLTD